MDYPGYECSEQSNGMYSCKSDYWSGSDCGMFYGSAYCQYWDYNYYVPQFGSNSFYTDSSFGFGTNYFYTDYVMDYPGYVCMAQGNGMDTCVNETWTGTDCYMWMDEPFCSYWEYNY